MVGELPERRVRELVPHHELIIVPAAGQLTVVAVPTEAAHLLLVTDEAAEPVLRGAHVAVVDESVSRARRQDVGVPGEGANPGGVAFHGPQTTGSFGIPYLNMAVAGANGEMCAFLDPRHARDGVLVEGAEFGDAAALGVPHVDAGAESDTNDVCAAPVDKVEVKVVGQLGRVEDLEGNLDDGTWLAARTKEHLLAAKTDGREAVHLGARVEDRPAALGRL